MITMTLICPYFLLFFLIASLTTQGHVKSSSNHTAGQSTEPVDEYVLN